jgi:L-fuculose-phosphate aldolase
MDTTTAHAVSAFSQLIWERGWVANHDGNITARLADGTLAATPTAVSKRLIGPADVIHLERDGAPIEGTGGGPGRPFSELVLHQIAYRVRDDARAVIHAHPPTATGFAMGSLEVDPTITPEAVVSLGDRIPLVPHFLPGDPRLLDALGQALVTYDAVCLRNHGVLTVGDDLEMAYLRMELVEHLAKMQLVARQTATVRDRLPRIEIDKLLAKRTKAGLGIEGRRQKGAAPLGLSQDGGAGDDLASLIASEVKAALRS